jgi:hypothetical protein
MSITINGTTGIAGVDGSAATPSVQGADANTGVFFPAADTVALTTGGSERMRVDSSGNVGIGTSSPTQKLGVNGSLGMPAATTEERFIEIGAGRTGNGYAYIDFIGDATYTDFGLRIIRENNGANAASSIAHRGTGALALKTEEAAAITFSTTATERMRIDTSGNLLFNSGYGSVATAYGCRAWVRFGGAGTIAGSGNITSVTNSSTGRYVVSFTTAMPDANYAVSTGGTVTDGTGNPWQAWGNISRGYGTGSFTVDCSAQGTTGAGQANWAIVTVAVFR